MNEDKPKFVRFTNNGYDHTSGGQEVPYYVSPLNKFLDLLLNHKWVYTLRKDEIRCDRCWKLADFPTVGN